MVERGKEGRGEEEEKRRRREEKGGGGKGRTGVVEGSSGKEMGEERRGKNR